MNAPRAAAVLVTLALCGLTQPILITATLAMELNSLAGEWVERGQNDLFYELDILANGTFQLYPVRSYERSLREMFYYNKYHLNLVGKLDGNQLRGTASKSIGDCVYQTPFSGEVHSAGQRLTIRWTAPACATAGATGQHVKSADLRRP